jgi:hypothetical protein
MTTSTCKSPTLGLVATERQRHMTQVEELTQEVCRARRDEISEPAHDQLRLRVLVSLRVGAGA